MKNVFLLTTTLLLAGLAPAPAQNRFTGGAGYFMAGYSQAQTGNLQERLGSAGLPVVGNGYLFMGGGGHFVYRNFIIGGEGGGTFANNAENSNGKVQASYGYGLLNLGYIIARNSRYVLYPLAGIGGGGMSLLITDRANLPGNFNDLLADPGHQASLSNGGMILNFSIGADWFLTKTEGEAPAGWLVGLKLGYLLSLNQDNWQIDKMPLTGGPDSGLSGFYVRLTIGGGGFTSR